MMGPLVLLVALDLLVVVVVVLLLLQLLLLLLLLLRRNPRPRTRLWWLGEPGRYSP